MDTKSLKTLKNLYLTTAIIATVNAIPGFGFLFNLLFGIPALAVAILAIIQIVAAKKAKQSVAISVLALVTGTIGFISAIIILLAMISDGGSSSYYMNSYGSSGNPVFGFAMLIGFCAWAMFVVTTVLHYVQFAKINKMIKMESFNQQQY
ncbi:hypothetical protein [Culicoidibacter larvae]|uniref:Uncharacterized protein n=1 Tax=Culicoidibacter larvae TaxID=2579976 RepID=A0A5R8QG01_9FIRM|nr:hypothetical protein [Culicoidibacter larvae]TLG75403.1 hypothetical protein FEZ08_04965 [Culicoidibacter larvae]